MFNIENVKAVKVVMEPGDSTHYEFILYQISEDVFSVATANIASMIIYPDRMSIFDARSILKNWASDEVRYCPLRERGMTKREEIGEKFKCDPRTVLAVAKAIVYMNENYYQEEQEKGREGIPDPASMGRNVYL